MAESWCDMKLEYYLRADGKWAWRLVARNGQVVATDGGQGYENRADAVGTAESVLKKSGIASTTFNTSASVIGDAGGAQ